MTKNMGKTDRFVRILLAVAIGVLYLTDQIAGTVAIILGVVSLVFVATSFAGTCLLYLPCKLSTTGKDKESQ